MNRRLRLIPSIALAMLVAMATIAIANPDVFDEGVVDNSKDVHGHKHDRHGAEGGHLEGSVENVELVSELALRNVVPEKIADVGVYGDYAYLAAWGVVTCKYNGVHVVDISDVEEPREVAFIPSKEGSYPGEGIQVLTIDTPEFSGDILVSNNEKCNQTTGFGGMNIYNVTNPKAPTPLYEGFGDTTAGDTTVPGTGKKSANEIHSVFAWDAGEKAYAVMVDNEELSDVDIVDISNPKKPTLVAEYDLVADFPEADIDQAGLPEIWHHDMIVKEIDGRQIMLVSYWDGGYVQLDVTDPANAEVLAQSDYEEFDPLAQERGLGDLPPEGNGHQGEFTMNDDYVIATDEDFDPYKLSALDDEGEPFTGTMGIAMDPGATLPDDLVYVGQACTAASVPASTGDQIALVERGVCAFTEKVASVEAQGYEAMIVFNNEDGSSPTCTGLINMLIEGNIPSFFVGRDTAFDLMDQPYDDALCMDGDLTTQPVAAAPGAPFNDAVTISSYFDGWGYVHLFDAETMESLDQYAIPEAHDAAYAAGAGDLSIHEVATSKVDNDLAYYAYYSGGFRVTRIVDDELVEVGHYIHEDGSNLWGVDAFLRDGEEYAATSDRDYGLQIFKYTGED